MLAYLHRVNVGVVDVLALKKNAALYVGAGDEVIHTVKGAQNSAFAAAGRADHGGDLARLNL
ncbi:hypothetical protein SDC9_116016 [bioreactor metagenome]|uniref:Uncharacterized protein n=1 Tax=bioreactor metagenome TaxID=1076179 RepID=A0A645BUZ0_9ZZZZ